MRHEYKPSRDLNASLVYLNTAFCLDMICLQNVFFDINNIFMPLSKDQKQVLLDELIEKMKKAESVTFANYTSTTVAEQSKLRRDLRDNNAELQVVKKTIIKLAAKEIGITDIAEESLEGQIVIALSYDDPMIGAQTIKKHSKKVKNFVLKGGIFEGRALDGSEIKAFADLPSKEVLLSRLIGSMQSPISGFVGVSSAVVGGFVRVVNAYQEQRLEQESK
jgi:large subunit ribosomal protein L10